MIKKYYNKITKRVFHDYVLSEMKILSYQRLFILVGKENNHLSGVVALIIMWGWGVNMNTVSQKGFLYCGYGLIIFGIMLLVALLLWILGFFNF